MTSLARIALPKSVPKMKKRATISSLFAIIKASAIHWHHDNGSMHCAAISYYAVFSIAPLLLISIALAGLIFGEQASRGEIFHAINELVGDRGAKAVEAMIENASLHSHASVLVTAIGTTISLIGASGIFEQLQLSMNLIWRVKSKSGQSLWNLIRRRLINFSMVIIGWLILMMMVLASVAVTVSESLLGDRLFSGKLFWEGISFVATFVITGFLFALIFKILPDVNLSWADVASGGFLTAFLFDVGRYLIAFYLGESTLASTYGAAGSLIVVLLGAFYTSAIVFFGAEFTRVYAQRNGRKINPKKYSEFIVNGT